MTSIAIIGGGQAAGQAAASLRQEKFDGAIDIFCAEPWLPYQRPPLSKAYLDGSLPREKLLLRPEGFYEKQAITVHTQCRVSAADRDARTLTTEAGATHGWDHLILATGSTPRRLPVPGSDLAGIHYLRSIDDVDGIRDGLTAETRLVVVGGGYIGLEVAAVARKLGASVTVVETMPRILERVTTPAMSAFYTAVHEDAGVTILTGHQVEAFTGDGHVEAVTCAGGHRLDADLVVVGIGILPVTDLAEAMGLPCDNGIVVDERCRTEDPHVWAIGDCSNHPNPLLGRRIRLESVPNAMEQGRVAAANIVGKDKVHDSVPWFWSDQYDLKLQMVGFAAGADTEVVRGDEAARAFIRFYLRGGTVISADAVNNPREFMLCKQLVAAGAKADPRALADPEQDLKALLA